MRRRRPECSMCMCRLPIGLPDATIRSPSVRFRVSSRRSILLDLRPFDRLLRLHPIGPSLLFLEASNTPSTTEIRTFSSYGPTSVTFGFRTTERPGWLNWPRRRRCWIGTEWIDTFQTWPRCILARPYGSPTTQAKQDQCRPSTILLSPRSVLR
jgi:hypothetical protein